MAAAFLFVCPAPVVAAPSERATGLFAAGQYREAAAAGRVLGTVDGYILAGTAAGAQAAFATSDKEVARVLLQLAESDFDKALDKSPQNFDALLQKAVVIGYRAKLDSNPGLAKQARRNFEAIMQRWPQSALATAALAGWHGESVATLGKFLAGTALGAKEGEALKLYEKALALPGADPIVPYLYGANLLALSEGNAARAQALLQRCISAQTTDPLGLLLQKRARMILQTLDKNDPRAARAQAKKLAPLGMID